MTYQDQAVAALEIAAKSQNPQVALAAAVAGLGYAVLHGASVTEPGLDPVTAARELVIDELGVMIDTSDAPTVRQALLDLVELLHRRKNKH